MSDMAIRSGEAIGLASANASDDALAENGYLFPGIDLSPEQEAHVFWRMRYRLMKSMAARLLSHSRLSVALMCVLSVAFWIGLYVLFVGGFRFLSVAHEEMLGSIFNVFFASLLGMLIISTSILLYGSLYRTPEARLLLTMPVRPERIFAHKFQEAIWYSSWGFVLLVSPLLVAYGVASAAPWYYFVFLVPFVVSFVYIPAAIGAIVCVLVVYRMPTFRIPALGIMAGGALCVAAWLAYSIGSNTDSDLLTPRWFQEISGRLKFAEHRLLPSWWISTGLLEAARPIDSGLGSRQPWAESLLFLTLLISNAMFLYLLAGWVAKHLYRPSYNRLQGGRTARRRASVWWLDQVVLRGAFFLPRDIRLLIVKDLQVFRRDPVQWSQFLIFFGLLGLYFINIRRFSYDMHYAAWVNIIGFLNLSVVGLILATFTTRFIFPLVSIEGQRLWIIGLLPINRDRVLWAKFIFAATGSLIPCTSLIFVSDLMLQISPQMIVMHQLTCVGLCLGLSAIAVGLGARMPDLREQSPSKIAAGFGGTLNLVLSAVYICLTISPTAAICFYFWPHLHGVSAPGYEANSVAGAIAIVAAAAITLMVAGFACWLPMKHGLRTFRQLEF